MSIDNNVVINNVTNSQNKTNGNPFENEIDNEEDRQDWPIDRTNKIIDLTVLRPTDIPNKSIILARPLKKEKETKLQQVK